MEQNIKSRHPVNVIVYTNAAAVVSAKLIYKEAAPGNYYRRLRCHLTEIS